MEKKINLEKKRKCYNELLNTEHDFLVIFFLSFFLSFFFLTFSLYSSIFISIKAGSGNHQHPFCCPSQVLSLSSTTNLIQNEKKKKKNLPLLSTLLIHIFIIIFIPILHRKSEILSLDEIRMLFSNVEVMSYSLQLILKDLRTAREEEILEENLGNF